MILGKKNEKDAQDYFFDRQAYRRRDMIERSVASLKEMHRLATR